MLNWHGYWMSVMEMPFSSDEYREIAASATSDLRKLLNLPVDYHILFLQGGAYAHFALLAMNLMGNIAAADYIQTGHWSTRAIYEAKRYGQVNIAASAEPAGFNHIPPIAEWRLDPAAAYCHITTNETANGVQFHWLPDTGDVPLVADMTSDFLARQLDVSRFGLVYASAQKNVGPDSPSSLSATACSISTWISRRPYSITACRRGMTLASIPRRPSVYTLPVLSLHGCWRWEGWLWCGNATDKRPRGCMP